MLSWLDAGAVFALLACMPIAAFLLLKAEGLR